MSRKDLEFAALGSLIETVSPRGKQLKTDAYASTGRLPIVDQGQQLIIGYTDEDIEPISDVPVVVFGDHTRIVKYIDFPFIVGADGTKLIKPNTPDIDRTYFYYLVHQAASTMDNLGYSRHFKELKELDIGYHTSVTEQRKIAAILRTWDDAIEKAEKLVDANRKRLSSLTLALVFGRLRLSRRCSSDRTKYKLISGPKDWKLLHICDVALERSELNVGGAAHTVLSCSKHDGFVKSLDFFKKQVFSKDLASYKIICRGDFGFPSNHVEEGSIGLQNIADKAVVSPIYIVFTPNTKHVHPDFLFRLLKTKTYAHIFRTATSSSVDRRGNLRWTEFSRIPLFLPELKEQAEINAFLNEQQKLIDGLEQYRQTLVTQKRGLMQKLLTGEWRVNVSGDAEAA